MLIIEMKKEGRNRRGRRGRERDSVPHNFKTLWGLYNILLLLFLKYCFYFVHINVLSTPVYDVCASHACLVSSGIGMWCLLVVVSHDMGAGNQTRILCKSIKSSQQLQKIGHYHYTGNGLPLNIKTLSEDVFRNYFKFSPLGNGTSWNRLLQFSFFSWASSLSLSLCPLVPLLVFLR